MQIIRGLFGILAIIGLLGALIGIGLMVGVIRPVGFPEPG